MFYYLQTSRQDAKTQRFFNSKNLAALRLGANILLLTVSVLFVGCGSKENAAVREASKLLADRQYDQARAVIDSGLRETPDNPKLLRLQVRYFLVTEQTGFCAVAWQKLLEVSPQDTVLRDAVDDKNPAVRLTAVRVLGETQNDKDALFKAADDGDKAVRQAVIQSLVKLNAADDRAILHKLLNDADWFVRGNATLALGGLGDTGSVALLFKALADNDAYVRKSARLSLQRLATPENLPAYQTVLNADPADADARSLAAIILASTGDASAFPVLAAELGNHDNPDLPEIMQTLAKNRYPDALPALRQLAADPTHADVQLNAILALGDYKDRASLEPLKNLQKNPQASREIKTACAVALNNITKK